MTMAIIMIMRIVARDPDFVSPPPPRGHTRAIVYAHKTRAPNCHCAICGGFEDTTITIMRANVVVVEAPASCQADLTADLQLPCCDVAFEYDTGLHAACSIVAACCACAAIKATWAGGSWVIGS